MKNEPWISEVLKSLATLPATEHLWVAVSGGLDSVLLLSLLDEAMRSGTLTNISNLGVLHVNHKLRGAESDGDEQFVRDLAKTLNLPVEVDSLIWQEKDVPSQNSCRERRYEFFERMLAQSKNTRIALAHHLDDQAETVLLRIMRGTGVRGLQAMQFQLGQYVRPLLEVQRSQILSAATTREISWREDSSNQKQVYDRNWLRLEIMPLIEKRRPGINRKLAALAADAQVLCKESASVLEPIRVARSFGAATMYSVVDLQRASAESLVSTFHCERKHVEMIQKLVIEGSGKLSLPKRVMWVSCGWALVAKSVDDWYEQVRGRPGKNGWQSLVGTWNCGTVGETLRGRAPGDGKRMKFRLQKSKVPAFLRAAIPVMDDGKGKADLLLPRSIFDSSDWYNANGKQIKFTSSLGEVQV